VTLGLIVARPRGLNEGVIAVGGGILAPVLGLVPLDQVLQVELGAWNIFLFFLGMMAVAALADQSGILDQAASVVAHLARGRVVLLYLGVFLLGTAISAFFANDSTALVLTPIVYALVTRLMLDPVPFVFATTFIADSASILLPVSNPLNIILIDRFHLNLASFVQSLWLPALLVVLVNVGLFLLLFRRQIRGRFTWRAPDGIEGVRETGPVLILLAVAYGVASALALPLGPVALAGAAAMGMVLARAGKLALARLAGEIGWPVFGFIAGMLIVVQALQDSGVTAALARDLLSLGHTSRAGEITAAVVGSALGANLINNLPMALVMASAIHAVHATGATRLDLVYSSIVGCDLGPNLTHLGSLATLLWLLFLRRKGLDVSVWQYFRIGLILMPPMLAAAILGLVITTAH
jgi:arsenical pump membrane protein